MFDGVVQSFLGVSSGKPEIPYHIADFEFLHPPTSSSIRVEIIYSAQRGDSPLPGVVSGGDLTVYPPSIQHIFFFVYTVFIFIHFHSKLQRKTHHNTP